MDWTLLERADHRGLLRWVSALNRLYRREPALHTGDANPAGFQWVDCSDTENSVLTLLRKPVSPTGLAEGATATAAPPVLAVFNHPPPWSGSNTA